MLCFLHNQKKDNSQFKNKNQSELPENQTAWNSNNQGDKVTFIHTGRRGGKRQPVRGNACQDSRLFRQGGGVADQVIPHSCAGKSGGGTNGEQDRPSNPGFQCGAIKPQNI